MRTAIVTNVTLNNHLSSARQSGKRTRPKRDWHTNTGFTLVIIILLSANSLGKKHRYALHFWGLQNFDNSSKTFTIDLIPFILLKGFPIHLSHIPDIKKYNPNVFPIKGTCEDLWWNCRANMTYVMCKMYPTGGNHTHQVFARTSGDSILIHDGHEQ